MRSSRDLVRPLAALLVIVAAVVLASNVAAYRVATTPDHAADHQTPQADAATTPHPDDGGATATGTDRSTRRTQRGDQDGDDDRTSGGDDDGDGQRVVVVTETGAS